VRGDCVTCLRPQEPSLHSPGTPSAKAELQRQQSGVAIPVVVFRNDWCGAEGWSSTQRIRRRAVDVVEAPATKGPIMQQGQQNSPRCSVCGEDMQLAVIIPPFSGQYGLKAFACPKCGRTESLLVAPMRTTSAR
jgi:rRNA maturation protein Nop10